MTPFVIHGKLKNNQVTQLFVYQLMQQLGIQKFTKKYIDIKVVAKVDGAYGLWEGETDYAEILLSKTCPSHEKQRSLQQKLPSLS